MNHATKHIGSNFGESTKRKNWKMALAEKGLLQMPKRMLFNISLVVQYVITGNTEKILKKNLKILYHYASTANKTNHTSCPTDNQGLFGYQRNIANGSSTYKPHGAWAI